MPRMSRKTFPTLVYEHAFWRDGFHLVAGLDEAGRGALAGPVVAAAVILPRIENAEQWTRNEMLQRLARVNDSKQLNERAREDLFEPICESAVAYAIGVASQIEIDEINVLNASRLAMQRALARLSPPPTRCYSTRWYCKTSTFHNKASFTATRSRYPSLPPPSSPK